MIKKTHARDLLLLPAFHFLNETAMFQDRHILFAAPAFIIAPLMLSNFLLPFNNLRQSGQIFPQFTHTRTRQSFTPFTTISGLLIVGKTHFSIEKKDSSVHTEESRDCLGEGNQDNHSLNKLNNVLY